MQSDEEIDGAANEEDNNQVIEGSDNSDNDLALVQ